MADTSSGVTFPSASGIPPHIEIRDERIEVSVFLPSGERMWTMDLGWGIEAGLNYQPMVVWDLDGDGRAEVILKTNRSGDPLNHDGERISVLDGRSGKIKKETQWPSLKGLGSDYNNDSRNYLAIAHLDGKDPYVIAVRGLYKAQRMLALDKTPLLTRTDPSVLS